MEQEQGFIDYIEQSIIKNWDRNALTDMPSNGGHYLTGGYRLDQVPAFLAFAQTIYAWALTRVETLGTAK